MYVMEQIAFQFFVIMVCECAPPYAIVFLVSGSGNIQRLQFDVALCTRSRAPG